MTRYLVTRTLVSTHGTHTIEDTPSRHRAERVARERRRTARPQTRISIATIASTGQVIRHDTINRDGTWKAPLFAWKFTLDCAHTTGGYAMYPFAQLPVVLHCVHCREQRDVAYREQVTP